MRRSATSLAGGGPMSDERTEVATKAPESVRLKVEIIEVLLHEVKERRCMWDYPRTSQLLDRAERLIVELRGELGLQAVNEDLTDLVGEIARHLVRQDRDFDRTTIRELTQRLGLEFP